MREGILVYDYETKRYDIRFDLENYYGGLHCGETFEIDICGRWTPTTIEMGNDWYCVGIKTELQGLKVRI